MISMSEWMSPDDRLPTDADSDSDRNVWVSSKGQVYKLFWGLAAINKHVWMPITKPAAYVGPEPGPDTSLAASIERLEGHDWLKKHACRQILDDIAKLIEAARNWDEQVRQMKADFDAMTELGFNECVDGKASNDPDGVGEGWESMKAGEMRHIGGYEFKDRCDKEWKSGTCNGPIEPCELDFNQYRRRIETPEPTSPAVSHESDLRERLGKRVRQVWVDWAKRHPNPKPSWLIDWDDLPEDMKEVDRCIGAAIYGDCFAEHQEAIASHAIQQSLKRTDEPPGKPREFWLDLQCGAVIEIDDTSDCGDAVDMVRVREVNDEHDEWTAKLIELCEAIVGYTGSHTKSEAVLINDMCEHMEARPQ
jgi:hypothetical protein